jgi:hypothetical protein
MTADVYTTDQLFLLARVCAVPLPPSLHPQWTDGDELVADVVATRTLLAMGALALVPGRAELRPTAAVAAALDPVREAVTVAEVSRTGRDGATQRQVLVGHAGAGLRLREREPEVWVLEPGASVGELLDEALAALTDGGGTDGGGTDGGGAPGGAVGGEVGAVAGRVSLAHRLGAERYALDEVSWRYDAAGWWLAGGDGERPATPSDVDGALRAMAVAAR